MNPLTNVKNLNKLNERELQMGLAGSGASWHKKYRDSAWIFVGGLPYGLTEGDVVCVFSQYGELVNINMVRDKATGKTKGFCFLCYEDQRSTDLAVDNFNGIKILGRTIRVDHVENYKVPKEDPKHELDEITKKVRVEGIAPKAAKSSEEEEEPQEFLEITPTKKKKKEKKVKKEKKHKKKKKKQSESSSDSDSSASERESSHKSRVQTDPDGVAIKTEKINPDYDKYRHGSHKLPTNHRVKHEEDKVKVKSEGSYYGDNSERTSSMKYEHKKERQRHDSESSGEESVRRKSDYRDRHYDRRERSGDMDVRRRHRDDRDYNRGRNRSRERERSRERSHDRNGRRRDRSRDRR